MCGRAACRYTRGVRGAVAIACVVLAACAGPPATPRAPNPSRGARCILRISHHGTFVDGEPMDRARAVAHCKRAPGGAVVVIEDTSTRVWDPSTRTMVAPEEAAIRAAWDATRTALEREGVRIYVRGPLCHDPQRLGCRPQAPPASPPEPPPSRRPERRPFGADTPRNAPPPTP